MEASGPPTDTTQAQQPAAGWYPNPKGSGQRYWDGKMWTQHVSGDQPAVVPPAAPSDPNAMGKHDRNNGLAIAGYILWLIPIVGLIIGLVLRSRHDVRGNYVLVATGIWFLLGVLITLGGS